MTFQEVMDRVAQAFEGIGGAVLLGGLVLSVVVAGRSWSRERDGAVAYRLLRRTFGGVILLGLEILVAADLLRTVAVSPTLQNVIILAVIVLIRTFLSFSLEIEIEGIPPWRRALLPGFAHRAPRDRISTAAGSPGTPPGPSTPTTPQSGDTTIRDPLPHRPCDAPRSAGLAQDSDAWCGARTCSFDARPATQSKTWSTGIGLAKW